MNRFFKAILLTFVVGVVMLFFVIVATVAWQNMVLASPSPFGPQQLSAPMVKTDLLLGACR